MHLFSSCFHLIPILWKSGKFQSTRIGNTTLITVHSYISLSRYRLFGVGYCLFVLGLTRASCQINERLHTFFLSVTHRSRSRYGTNLIFMKQKAFAWGFIFFFVVTFIALWGDDGFSSIDIWGFVLVCIPCGFVGFLGGAIAMVMVKNKRKEDEE